MLGVVKVRDRGGRWYAKSATVGTFGARVYWEPVTSSSSPSEVYVVVPQGALDALGWEGQKRLIAGLRSLGFRASRVDVSFDDLARLVDPVEVLAALDAGQKRSHVRDWRHAGDSGGGWTTYIGSRTGECMVRSYRKWAESGDPTAGVRWEGEFKGDRAPLVADLMLGSAAPAATFWSLVRATIDFCDRTGHVNGSEAPLLAWWLALVGSADRARLVGEKVADSMAGRYAWLRRQVVPSLALVFARDGSRGIEELIRAGWDRAPWELIGLEAAP
jgi:DNA relaxase NicK